MGGNIACWKYEELLCAYFLVEEKKQPKAHEFSKIAMKTLLILKKTSRCVCVFYVYTNQNSFEARERLFSMCYMYVVVVN